MEPLSSVPASKSLYQNFGRIYRRIVLPRCIHSAELIVTLSQYSKNAILSKFNVDSGKIRVIPVPIPDSWYVETPAPWKERGSYMLCVSGEAPSKNLPFALSAYAQLKKDLGDRTPSLVIAGVSPRGRSDVLAIAARLGISGHVRLLEFIPLSELQSAYRKAQLVFAPSLQEGFGLPVLEAMASGTPVVSSDSSSLPEVGGNAAVYFDPQDEAAAIKALRLALSDESLRHQMVLRGMERAREFKGMPAKLYKALWQEVLDQSRDSEMRKHKFHSLKESK
jgi:glycosyltransferase involved in cell wall biosynthesis